MHDRSDKSIKGMSELHGFDGSGWLGGVIVSKIRKINNRARAAVELRNDAYGMRAKVGKMANRGVRQDKPLPFRHHGSHVFP
jgi:hypothetical protein